MARSRQEPINRAPTDELSAAELDVLRKAAQGLSAAATAKQRWTSLHTVGMQRRMLKRKLGVRTIAQAVAVAKDRGLI